jgi:gamma-glutamyltranspeptidase/glutathione hydrolase
MKLQSCEQYVSRRSPAVSARGMVASAQPLATLAGLDTLHRGGNAADAAVAVAAALQVTQPCSTGLGGDCFVLYYSAADRQVQALNGSGRCPAALSLQRLQREGFRDRLPPEHAYTVTVPGAPAAWAEVATRLGRKGLSSSLGPAIELAERGFAAAPLASLWWRKGASEQLARHPHGEELMIDGRGPYAGEQIRLPTLARSLQVLAEKGAEPFYRGEIAERIVAAVREAGGALALEDLAAHASEWVQPIRCEYHGYHVWECPPNGHGLAVLLALNVLKACHREDEPAGGARRLHLLIEAMRLAFADALRYVADPAFAAVPLQELLSEAYARERARQIDPRQAMDPPAWGVPPGAEAGGSDTVYFCTADAEGNACSFINSNYMGFGTGIVPAGCGYSLQNRGYGFRLDPEHPNRLEPGKRPYHTIIPALATQAATGKLFSAFGVMGGMMQPQGHLQVFSALVDDDLDPQAALDRGRFQLEEGDPAGPVLLEDALGEQVAAGLERLGHRLRVLSGLERPRFGLGQVILKDPNGVLWGASDPRGDGCALPLP